MYIQSQLLFYRKFGILQAFFLFTREAITGNTVKSFRIWGLYLHITWIIMISSMDTVTL